MKKNYKNILFDLDGTLSDPKEGIVNSILYALEKMEISESSPEELVSFIGPPLLHSFQMRYGLSVEDSKVAIEYYREYFPEKGMYENILYPGIPELLKKLKDSGRNVFLATSKPQVYATEILRHFKILPHFTGVVGAELDGTRNEKDEVIGFLMQLYGIDAEETIMIGDRKYDMIGASRHNLPVIGVTYGYGSETELLEHGATHIVHTVEHLGALLLN